MSGCTRKLTCGICPRAVRRHCPKATSSSRILSSSPSKILDVFFRRCCSSCVVSGAFSAPASAASVSASSFFSSSSSASMACTAGTKQCLAYSCSDRNVEEPGPRAPAPSSLESSADSSFSADSSSSSSYTLAANVMHWICAAVLMGPVPPPATAPDEDIDDAPLIKANAPRFTPSNESVDAYASSHSSSSSLSFFRRGIHTNRRGENGCCCVSSPSPDALLFDSPPPAKKPFYGSLARGTCHTRLEVKFHGSPNVIFRFDGTTTTTTHDLEWCVGLYYI
mmetsp:Transcript_53368/g.79779  ORF Transcript_53368/g.79779 Transcript_53368/m.79779 type:complete len:280 (-) Transcript_53368:37-876(-)